MPGKLFSHILKAFTTRVAYRKDEVTLAVLSMLGSGEKKLHQIPWKGCIADSMRRYLRNVLQRGNIGLTAKKYRVLGK